MIVQKIYFEKFQIEELKGYIIPAFKKITGMKSFLNILAQESDQFGQVIINLIQKHLDVLPKS